MATVTLLTPLQITRKALMILHQKANFIGSIDRQHDDAFAKEGAKIGNTLRIRLPNKYTVRTNATLSAQDTVEEKVDLVVSNQYGVDVEFSSVDLTLSLDDFSSRILEPAMSVLAAKLEATVMSNMIDAVYNQVNNAGSPITFSKVLQARKKISDNLAPLSNRYCNLNTQDNVDLVDALKGLFNEKNNLNQQYLEGYMGRTAGFDFLENTLWPRHSDGTHNTGYLTNQVAAQTGSSLIVDTGTGTIAVGDIFTIEGVYRVHPETKATLTELQQFTVTAAHSGGAGTLSITPAIVASGAKQNVSNGAANDKAITFAQAASTNYGLSLAYHKSAFTMATADLVMPKGVDFSAREVMDGISMRIVRAYDINNDKFPCRLDILWGATAQRPELACRLANS